MFNFLSPNFAIDVFLPIAKWLAIGVVATAIIVGLIVFFVKRPAFKTSLRIILAIMFVFLLALGLTCLIMDVVKSYDPSEIGESALQISYILIPLCILVALLLFTMIALFCVNKLSAEDVAKKNFSLTAKICGAVDLVALIVCGVLLAIYYDKLGDTSANQLVLYISSALLIISIVALSFILDKNKKSLDTKCIAMAGISIAMSFGLSYIKLFEMPQGGSVTLFSLLPLMIFSYIYGTKKGVLVCFAYGILQAIQDPWIIHPAQFLLDYPIAFSAIGLSGMFANFGKLEKFPQVTLLLGGLIASSIRFVSHVFSGVFAFASYAGDMNPWIYSLGYNSFVFVDIAITLVAGVLIFSSKAFVKEVRKISEN